MDWPVMFAWRRMLLIATLAVAAAGLAVMLASATGRPLRRRPVRCISRGATNPPRGV
jgi:hypothetical protein